MKINNSKVKVSGHLCVCVYRPELYNRCNAPHRVTPGYTKLRCGTTEGQLITTLGMSHVSYLTQCNKHNYNNDCIVVTTEICLVYYRRTLQGAPSARFKHTPWTVSVVRRGVKRLLKFKIWDPWSGFSLTVRSLCVCFKSPLVFIRNPIHFIFILVCVEYIFHNELFLFKYLKFYWNLFYLNLPFYF